MSDPRRDPGEPLVRWADLSAAAPQLVGTKAAVLARLAAEGFRAPPGFVVTAGAFDVGGLAAGLVPAVRAEARATGGDRFAVRSSAVDEDRPGARRQGCTRASSTSASTTCRRRWSAAGVRREPPASGTTWRDVRPPIRAVLGRGVRRVR